MHKQAEQQKNSYIIYVLWGLLSLAILCISIWTSLAFWVQFPLSISLKYITIALWWLLTLTVLGTLFKYLKDKYLTAHLVFLRRFYQSLFIYLFCFLGVLYWWQTIEPQQDRQWAEEVSRLLEVDQQGSNVTLHNVRNFDWYSPTEFNPRWETRQYDLDQLSSLDVITSYWMGPQIAHVLLSFGFDNGEYLTFSIETRREQTESFSTIGGFFRKFELSLIAADERDILYTRSNIRGEQVYLYRMDISRQNIRRLFEAYLDEANQLKQAPRFYNTLTSNCTTIVFDMARIIDPGLPVDYRIILSGYLPQYIYDQNGLKPHIPFKQLKQHAYVNPHATQYAVSGNNSSQAYSKAIRQGVLAPIPSPSLQ